MYRRPGPGDDVRGELRGRGHGDQFLDGNHGPGDGEFVLESVATGLEGRDSAAVRHPQRHGYLYRGGPQVGRDDRRQEVPGPLEVRAREQGGRLPAAYL